MVQIHTRNFGEIEITDDKILSFPFGLPGFPDYRRFALITDPVELKNNTAVFYWLQSLEDADIAFCLIDLIKIMPDYNPLVDETVIMSLGVVNPEDFLIYNMIVLHDNPKDITVNMKAPLVINPQTRQGLQVICQNEDYAIRHRMFN